DLLAVIVAPADARLALDPRRHTQFDDGIKGYWEPFLSHVLAVFQAIENRIAAFAFRRALLEGRALRLRLVRQIREGAGLCRVRLLELSPSGRGNEEEANEGCPHDWGEGQTAHDGPPVG